MSFVKSPCGAIRLTEIVLFVAVFLVPSAAVAQDARTAARTFKAYLPHESGMTIDNYSAGSVCIENDKPTEICEAAEFIDIVGENMCR